MSTDRKNTWDPVAWLPEEWGEMLTARGERAFRALEIFRWIHKRGVTEPGAMSSIGKSLRAAMEAAGLTVPATFEDMGESSDGTRKGVVVLRDGARVETVLIPPMPDDSVETDELDDTEPSAVAMAPVTQCISSQVGCAMGCVFCASGVAGIKRNMTAAEIVSQVLLGRAILRPDQWLRNVVLMGMGEPLHNYDQVSRALRLLTHPEGIGLSTRRVTVSTSGLVPEIDRLGTEFRGQVQLAISLHAPDDELRTALMPINKRYPLAELVGALRRYPLAPRRRITIEYTLIRDVNDTDAHARAVVRLLKGVPMKVNLIPMNPIVGSRFGAPTSERVESFQKVIREMGHSAFIRKQRGEQIDAACGQLALRGEAPRKRRLPTLLSSIESVDPQVHTDA